MRYKEIIIVIFLVLGISSQGAVKVTIYYESLCPASVQFITQQVVPTWLSLGLTYMKVYFVPYGKAQQVSLPGRGWDFISQHGPAEYYGNKLQACGLHVLRISTKKKVEFVNCVMSSADPKTSAWMCTRDMSRNVSADIEDCFHGVLGDELLAHLGDKTRASLPPIGLAPNTGTLPRVEFNGVYNGTEEEAALDDLKTVICNKMTEKYRERCLQRSPFRAKRC